MSETTKPRPFLHWAGGKGYLLPEILRRMPPLDTITRYVEPFLGGGAVFLGLRAAGYLGPSVLSDASMGLMGTWGAVGRDAEGVARQLQRLVDNHHGADSYYAARRHWNRPDAALCPGGPMFRAALCIYLSWCGFNGLWRENSRGKMNVSVGTRGKKPRIDLSTAVEAVREVGPVLANASLWAADFREILRDMVLATHLAYLDPPYTVTAPRSAGHNYTAGGWSAKDRADLSDIVAELAARRFRVLVSEAWTEEALVPYRGIPGVVIDQVFVPRRISRDGKGRGAVPEALIASWRWWT